MKTGSIFFLKIQHQREFAERTEAMMNKAMRSKLQAYDEAANLHVNLWQNPERRRIEDVEELFETAEVDHSRRIEPQSEKRAETEKAEQQRQPAMTPEEMAKNRYGVAEKFCFCTRWDSKRVLEWISCEIPCHFVL